MLGVSGVSSVSTTFALMVVGVEVIAHIPSGALGWSWFGSGCNIDTRRAVVDVRSDVFVG